MGYGECGMGLWGIQGCGMGGLGGLTRSPGP